MKDDYLFASHAAAEIGRWARALRYFRFCRATPLQQANDGDRFVAAVGFEGEGELLAILASLGLRAERPDAGAWPISRAGQAVPIPALPHLAQPGRQSLEGATAFVWARSHAVEVTIVDPDDPYQVTERAFRAAQRLEGRLEAHRLRIIDPPVDHPLCVCPKYHPHFWPALPT